MYIFRWLMKYPLIMLAVYFVGIVAVIYSMTGGGDSSDAEMATTTQSEKLVESDGAKIEPSTLTSALVNGESTETAEAASTETKDTDLGKSEVTETDSKTEETSAATYFEKHGVDPSLNAPTVITNDAEKPEVATETESNNVESNDSQFSEVNETELLLMAREAYWNNGLDESAQIYKQLIELNSETVDYKGELGNVYWRQGFPKKAAELYAEISLPMIKDGKTDRVANMVGFIGLFFPEKATEIHNALQENK